MKTNLLTLILLLCSVASFAQSADGKAIKRVIEEESAAFRQCNVDKVITGKTVYKNHDYQVRINGNSAWTTFITDAVAGTKKSQSYDARYLEKVNGVWKIVAVTGTPTS